MADSYGTKRKGITLAYSLKTQVRPCWECRSHGPIPAQSGIDLSLQILSSIFAIFSSDFLTFSECFWKDSTSQNQNQNFLNLLDV